MSERPPCACGHDWPLHNIENTRDTWCSFISGRSQCGCQQYTPQREEAA